MCFVLFPGLSSSGVQVLGECTVPGETCVIITSPVRVTRIPGVCPESTVLDVSPLESLSQPVTLLASVNRPASQEDMISNWEPAHSLWKMRSLRLRLQQPLAFWLWLSLTCLSASREGGPCMQLACSPLVFALSFVLLVCQGSLCIIRAFRRKAFFLFLSFWQSHHFGCYLTLVPSDCPQGNQA